MTLKMKNWKLNLLSLVFILIFIALGFWQISRAHQKTALLDRYEQRTKLPPATASDLATPDDWRFRQIILEGKFDDAHSILLDNKIFNGKIGYEVYTPMKANGVDTIILIDRGFVPIGASRDELPAIPKTAKGNVKIQGMVNTPPLYLAFGSILENGKVQWPLRVEYINLPELGKVLKTEFYPYVVSLNEASPGALQVKWQIVTVDPNKNKGYAVQWFAFALTLLIISVVLNRGTSKKASRDKKKKS